MNPASSATGRCSGTMRPLRRRVSESSVRKKSARSRSSRLTTMARGSSYSFANFQTFSVCTCTPATASATPTAASTTRRPARASAMKSPYPGVSTKLMRWPFQSQYATEVLIDILRLISSGSKSVVVLPSSTLPSRVTAPAVNSRASTREVLPTPPWPTTPTLRIFPISIAIRPASWERAVLGRGPMLPHRGRSDAEGAAHGGYHVIVGAGERSEEHTSELQSRLHLVCRLLLEKKKKNKTIDNLSTRKDHI